MTVGYEISRNGYGYRATGADNLHDAQVACFRMALRAGKIKFRERWWQFWRVKVERYERESYEEARRGSDALRAQAVLAGLEAERDRLRSALRFYTEPNNFIGINRADPPEEIDCAARQMRPFGWKAREALDYPQNAWQRKDDD